MKTQNISGMSGHNDFNTMTRYGEEPGALEAEPFYVAISRAGLIYFPDQTKGLQDKNIVFQQEENLWM